MVENIIRGNNDRRATRRVEDYILTSMENQLDLMEDELSRMEERIADYITSDEYDRSLDELWGTLDLFDYSRLELYEYLGDIRRGLIRLSMSKKTPFTQKLREDLNRHSRDLFNIFFKYDPYDYLVEMRRLRNQ